MYTHLYVCTQQVVSQDGENAENALRCRSLSAKEP